MLLQDAFYGTVTPRKMYSFIRQSIWGLSATVTNPKVISELFGSLARCRYGERHF